MYLTVIVSVLKTDDSKNVLHLNPVVLKAIDGANQTNTLVELMNSNITFHNLSVGGRSWGKLATWMTKFRAIEYQVKHSIQFAMFVEDDVIPSSNWNVTRKIPKDGEILKYSLYAEVFSMSLHTARRMLTRLKAEGIKKNDDQQLFTTNTTILNHRDVFKLSRKTNRGFIAKTPIMTWMEMAMLRKITSSPGFYREFLAILKLSRKIVLVTFSVPC